MNEHEASGLLARAEAYEYLLEALRHFLAQEQGKALKFNYPPETAVARYNAIKELAEQLGKDARMARQIADELNRKFRAA